MTNDALISASSRVALAAFLHDLGKFAERARIEAAYEKDAEGNLRAEINKQMYCPSYNGNYTHVHAAYTAIGMDLIEAHLPEIVGGDTAPFGAWKDRSADDSIINAAARHHKPDTFLQWIIATADRLASGFERETFGDYNAAFDDEKKPLNHYTTRQWTLLEQIRVTDRQNIKPPQWRYPLKPLSPEAIFPIHHADCEQTDRKMAQTEYSTLWDAFLEALEQIPATHRKALPLWLDHFDTLWLTFTHAIPSATTGGIKPDVSLYDHSSTTAALAVAIWRYHSDLGHSPDTIRESLRAQWDRERASAAIAENAWNEEKFLLIQGDLFGIQDFIFATGGETQKLAAKLLRGRSFYVSLLTELAALRLLEALSLPSTSQVVNAAGKFLIVAPNTQQSRDAVASVQKELQQWFLDHTYGQSGIGIALLPATSADFRAGAAGKSAPFSGLMQRLFEQLEIAKLQLFNLCEAENPLFSNYLKEFEVEKGACQIDGRSPAKREVSGLWLSELAADQIDTGHYLAHCERLLITRIPIQGNLLRLPIFGYYMHFTQGEEETGRFGKYAQNGDLRRAWDYSLPVADKNAALWNGYARRHINAYVPRFDEINEWDAGRYERLEDNAEVNPQEIKTLNHLACDDKRWSEASGWVGQEALTTLKGDVDNLGQIFQRGLEQPTFAKMAAMSRQMNAFFAIYLPWLCAHGQVDGIRRYRNTYTVFAGGDDFFLIGPWLSTQRLAVRMREDFQRYVATNPEIHFSAGLSMTKPGFPIRQMAELAENALHTAKGHNPDNAFVPPKNAITCHGQTVNWKQFDALLACESALNHLAKEQALSTGYLYGLLHLTDMAGKEREQPENALWHAYFAYRTRRMLESRIKSGDRETIERARSALQQQLALEIAEKGIKTHRLAYKISLFTYLYQQRS